MRGRQILFTLGIGAAAALAIGTATYFIGQLWRPAGDALITQIIVAEVYGALTLALLLRHRPAGRAPLALRYSSVNDVLLAVSVFLGVIVAAAALYSLLAPFVGSLEQSLRRVLAVATDAARRQDASASVWIVAIARGCVLVPLFEELLFRGLLLDWLRTRLPLTSAAVVSAVLFAVMHAYPIAMPYAFLFGLAAAWLRLRTGSTFNPWVMHVLNNLFFLAVGTRLFR